MTSPLPFTGFRPAALKFLRALKRNNNRDWFAERKTIYEQEVKHPLQLLVAEVDARLGAIAPEIIGDPKRSVFRIYRDVRFSEDKSPYKTAASAWFYHRDVGHGVGHRTHGGAGFYFQIAPDESFVAGGIWMPPSDALKQLRAAIARDHVTLSKIVKAPAFARAFGPISEEAMLTRPPRGYDRDHPAGQWLLYKSFTVSRDLTADQLASPSLPDILAKHYATMLPFVRWFNAALGYKAASRR